MKTMRIKSKVIAGLIIASMMSATTTAFAAENVQATNKTQGGVSYQLDQKTISTILDKLVETGVITSDEEPAIEAEIINAKGDVKTVLDKLEAKGIITSDQEKNMKDVLIQLDGLKIGNKQKLLQELLSQLDGIKANGNESLLLSAIDKLYEEGIITSNKNTPIKEAIVNAKGDVENALTLLVFQGVITSEEKITIETDLAKLYIDNKATLSETFNKLVALGIIDADKQTTIEEAINNGKEYIEPALDKLVSEGLITSDQKTILEDILNRVLKENNDSNISVDYKVETAWGNNVKSSVKVTNTSDSTIRNWALKVNFDGDINQIWDASIVSHTGNTYIIKNTGWPRDITTGAAVEFGFIASYDGESQPEFTNASIVSTEKTVDASDYSVDFAKNGEWDNGFNANLTVKNTGSEDIEDWTIDFDYKDTIESIPNAEIVSHEGDHYKVRCKSYNSVIKSGESLTLGFAGKPANGARSTEIPDNYGLTKIAY